MIWWMSIQFYKTDSEKLVSIANIIKHKKWEDCWIPEFKIKKNRKIENQNEFVSFMLHEQPYNVKMQLKTKVDLF